MNRRRNLRRLCALLLSALMLLAFAGCGAPTPRPLPTVSPIETLPPAPPSSPTPTEEEPQADPSEPPLPGIGVAPDGTFSDAALFIGDSLTAGLIQRLRMTERLGAARYMAICAYSMQSFFGEPYLDDLAQAQYGMECYPTFYGMTYAQAVRAAGEGVGAIYYMLGTNGSQAVTQENYTGILTYLRECCPAAVIYAQTIPYSMTKLSDYEHVNAVVRESVEALRAAGDGNVYVLDTFTAIGTEHLSGDGLHLTAEGLDLWYALIAGPYAKTQQE